MKCDCECKLFTFSHAKVKRSFLHLNLALLQHMSKMHINCQSKGFVYLGYRRLCWSLNEQQKCQSGSVGAVELLVRKCPQQQGNQSNLFLHVGSIRHEWKITVYLKWLCKRRFISVILLKIKLVPPGWILQACPSSPPPHSLKSTGLFQAAAEIDPRLC